MKKSYKIISLILCAVMLVFTLGACGSGGSDDKAAGRPAAAPRG